MQSGLERLETYTIHAERLGLSSTAGIWGSRLSEPTRARRRRWRSPRVAPLVKVSRMLLVEGKPAAWMVDVVPESVIGIDRVRERFRPDAMVLDLLVSEGVPVGFSQMFIEATMIGQEQLVGRQLGLQSPSAALSLTQTMYLVDGRPAQWSRDTFLPGHLNLHVVRELFEVRRLS